MKNPNRQNGAILVFFAIILVVLLGFVALVVDTGIGESGRAEEETSVQNAALAAMSSYLEVLKTPTPNTDTGGQNIPFAAAQRAAQSKAENILAASNKISNSYRVDPNADKELSTTTSNGEGKITFGRMVWAVPTPRSGEQPSEDQMACTSDGSLKVPCFRPVTGASESATAIKVTTLSKNNPLKTVFGRVLGSDRYDLGASAIATLIPQNYIFLLDLSPSIVDQSQRRFGDRDPTCSPPSAPNPYPICTDTNWYSNPACFIPASAWYFSYDVDLDRASTQGCNTFGTTGSCSCFSDLRNDISCLKFEHSTDPDSTTRQNQEETMSLTSVGNEERRARRIFAGYSNWWNTADATDAAASYPAACRPSLATRSQCPAQNSLATQCQHLDLVPGTRMRAEYYLVHSNLGGDLNQPPPRQPLPTQGYLVDFGPGGTAGSFRSQPEPLRSVLDATYDAMDYIKHRAVSADRFFLSGFDETLMSARTTCSTPNMNDCAPGDTFVSPASTSFNGFLNLTNVKPGADGWEAYSPTNNNHFINRTFFPRQGYNTDIQMALWKSYQELVATPNATAAKNLVFLITDGLANCKFVDPAQVPVNFQLSFSSIQEYISKRRCYGNPASIGQNVIQAIRQMNSGLKHSVYRKTLVELFREKNIAISVILIGQNVQPHRLVRPSTTPGGAGGCLTTSEAIYGGIDFVDWKTGSQGEPYVCTPKVGSCSSDGFNDAALAHDATAALIDPTGDVSLPISNYLYEELVAPTRGAWIPIMRTLEDGNHHPISFTHQLEEKCNHEYIGDPDRLGNGRSPILKGLNIDGHQVTDRNGRLLYDPEGRNQKDQIIDAIKQVLGGGYVLVEPAMRASN